MNLRDCFSALHAAMRRESGQTMAEYSLILALVALGLIATFTSLGSECMRLFDAVSTAIAP